ncbi:antitoxin VbhA family protein [uncultured Microbulbifer sp.]|uniref:antitoxin VbhA family protein n=1 Tax=uncultured Microbulbifer sp. TaxID=348147 RepID=UPI00261B609A|nr:antitoxin VbhA family protein [uncultured Microbulbifer sp.]
MSRSKDKKAEELVERAIASLNIEGIRVPEEEKEILRKIANGELDADEVADEIVRKALKDSKTGKS